MSKIIPLEEQLQQFEKDCFGGREAKRIISAYNKCVEKTKKFAKASGFDDVLIGLSGGIDSSLVAKIAVDAFGEKHVYGLLLPGPYSSQQSLQDANLLADTLGIKTRTLFINSAYEAVINSLDQAYIGKSKGNVSDLSKQNIQARCRMIMLMAVSNEYNWLLLNTSNKSEVYTGYSTLYGDMCGLFAPIGDVYKTDVYKMCVYKNLQERRMFENNNDVIPQSIINKAPSAELTDNQTDEASLGVDYATLDAILKEYIDNKKQAKDIVFLGYREVDVQKVINLVNKSEFKRSYEPPCAKIS